MKKRPSISWPAREPCPVCGTDAFSLGPLPPLAAVGGAEWESAGFQAGQLFSCPTCTLCFRAPTRASGDYLRLYESLGTTELWTFEGERPLWRHVRRLLERAPSRSVLDVGCFRGDFLSWLGEGWDRFAVEPSIAGRAEVRRRGIQVVGSTLDALPETGLSYGSITMIDVIEHLPRPLDALEELVGCLQPGGLLVLFTGSTDSLGWRLSPRHYWYAALPEHVCFFRPSWFAWAAPRLGCEVEDVQRHAYRVAGLGPRLSEAVRSIAYLSYRRLEDELGPGARLQRVPIVSRLGRWPTAWWTSARDHVLVALRRAAGSRTDV